MRIPRQVRHLQSCLTLAVAFVALVMIAACSKDKNVDEPAKLTPLPHPSLRVTHLWGHNMGDKKAAVLRLGQGVSITDNRVYAAAHKGEVVALELATGHLLWHAKTGAPLSGGTSSSTELIVVGASDGEVFAFDPGNGHNRWKVRLNGEVLAPAAISTRLVAVRTVDGKLHALSPGDGHELWATEQQVPRLSLRGTASPVISGELVLCGFDNGKVVAVNAADGSVQWEATVTPPHGRTELERLDDIDSPVRVSGRDVYAVGFQGKVAMLALDTGQVWWSHEDSSYRGVALDEDTLYLADSDGIVAALKARTGAEVWRQNVLLHRGLSPIAVMDESVVVGDFQGYLHFLDKASGALVARIAAGSARISNQPLVVGDIVVVANDRGQINAYRVKPLAAATRKAASPQKK
ncbi:MAG TPA: outer membrane protein assembly factor BamB [Steroidobacteraceae bacterium]|nr:outer membrane protein assembly factor BamB [Steroidobacteraceae bacterium]